MMIHSLESTPLNEYFIRSWLYNNGQYGLKILDIEYTFNRRHYVHIQLISQHYVLYSPMDQFSRYIHGIQLPMCSLYITC
ncbi:MAG: hypothetical protein J07HQW1_00117 [Haloquadratum walsbyi J07HQW1]|uniref:Uncharacterized protein n=1 Tax=Haloquadratum walsbyi J07HQW1 TaxID=1238424 RepID=U1MKI7_9EURY|nr:MAG: hypothetical protein J07HQW1_00117 [Haloquadratum walsbyi J07HQW1]